MPATQITPFLMFAGQATEAMDFYLSLFPGAEIITLQKYGADTPGMEGKIYQAIIQLAGQRVRLFDSPVKHDFTFTPAISLFVDCESEAQLDEIYGKFAEGGQVMMPLADYGFSRKFGWVSDRFGVSWQLNLPLG